MSRFPLVQVAPEHFAHALKVMPIHALTMRGYPYMYCRWENAVYIWPRPARDVTFSFIDPECSYFEVCGP